MVMLAPSLVFLASFTYWPIIRSVFYGFYDVQLGSTEIFFVGWENYQRLWGDALFWHSLRNTVVYMVVTVPTSIAMALVLAVALDRKLRGTALYRSVFFYPVMVPSVAAGMVWVFLYAPGYGPINGLMDMLGLPKLEWLYDPQWALPAIILMSIWKYAGYFMLILLAALQLVPRDLYEAARLDGVSGFRQLLHITVPLISPTLYFVRDHRRAAFVPDLRLCLRHDPGRPGRRHQRAHLLHLPERLPVPGHRHRLGHRQHPAAGRHRADRHRGRHAGPACALPGTLKMTAPRSLFTRSRWMHWLLLPTMLLWLSPLAWMFLTSFKTKVEVFNPASGLWPVVMQWSNYPAALAVAPFGTYLINSMLVTGGILLAQLTTITLAAYAFARLRFPGRDLLFGLFLLQVMFPIYATFLTNFITVRELGLMNSLWALMVPFIASGYGTFMLRQAFRQVPQDLADAARLDGCGHWATLWHVYLPLVKPTLIAFAMISVVTHWNDYMWPLLVTNSEAVRTLPIGLGLLAKADSGADWPRLMAATIVVIAPLMLLFLIFQRRFVDSFMHAGLK